MCFNITLGSNQYYLITLRLEPRIPSGSASKMGIPKYNLEMRYVFPPDFAMKPHKLPLINGIIIIIIRLYLIHLMY